MRFLHLYSLCLALGIGQILAKTQPAISLTARNTTQLQDIVTWDENSILVHGERVLLLSGEFHPFRLPSPDLWLDIFQKVRALGFSAVSFYLDWALLEGEPGHIRIDGVFKLDKFFSSAEEAGIYLIARPGPYINAEVSGGGFPGWLQRVDGPLRGTNPGFLEAITPYISAVGKIIARAQITNGGPVILLQPENEYTYCVNEPGYLQMNNMTVTSLDTSCLEKEYMQYVEEQYRKAGIVVPFIVNDAFPAGDFAPGTGVGEVDIYSFDFYPLGWNTAPLDPSNWSTLNDPRPYYNYTVHENQSPDTPFSISEYQGGSPDAWGGVGVDSTAAHIGPEFGRIFYKINYGYRAAIHNLYMIFGGTNWGNLGHPGGYTSYDVGAAIKEDRQVTREKYSELKLQAAFLQASPAYLLSSPHNGSYGTYTDVDTLSTTRLSTNHTNFFIVRHGNLSSEESTSYKLRIPTSRGNLTIPQLGGSLSLNGRDSKIHVADYDVGGINLVYSTAEVFSWKKSGSKSVLVLYGGFNETHELAVPTALGLPSKCEEGGLNVKRVSSVGTIIQWSVESTRRVVHFNDRLEIHLLSRNDAFNYWVLDLKRPAPLNRYASSERSNNSVIVKAGYLLRTADVAHSVLQLKGDINATTEIELIAGPPSIFSIYFNGKKVPTTVSNGRLSGNVTYTKTDLKLPDLASCKWHSLDSLPEITPGYDDSKWITCNHTRSVNPRNITTPTSLYASDYGFNGGSLLYRGSFVANGSEESLYLLTEAGYAYAHGVWINSTYLGSWEGSAADMFYNQTFSLGELQSGETYLITVLIDHMGNDENFPANKPIMKDPRGILDFDLHGRSKESVSWKIAGNIGGEHYSDVSRGPLNEGSIYAERQGYHLPGTPISKWEVRSPLNETSEPGVKFYATSFDLSIPLGYDVPISVVFTNTTSNDSSPASFRSEMFINGWQFGKYVNNVGPQVRYPVPEGILNYNGTNYFALTIWSTSSSAFSLAGLQLQADAVIQSGYQKPSLVQGQRYAKRLNAY
ncbi:beta-galactosidase, putative [Talaromyces stipitatus ATCC 10500]|uniref:Beta-galactosidase n=1 Tax=Talaromyces stipitatus (strain ATCC 10500 / CBS 375.48 / QM 6759 / NRRL 1006) TaxID=441959 RepID=B8MLY7_TALSN|nr:beta-galactosidase, putative [Talaromyces stipitatus ATCC 10500]EED13499.1 beta-galactosidase, putative [Talaromyces stipitatus ATCC 10500]